MCIEPSSSGTNSHEQLPAAQQPGGNEKTKPASAPCPRGKVLQLRQDGIEPSGSIMWLTPRRGRCLVKALLLGGCLGLATASLFGQAKPPVGGGGGATGGTTGVPSTRNSLPSSTNTPDYTQRPMFLSGKVVMDDGTPPPDSVTLQITCGSNPRSIPHTDS